MYKIWIQQDLLNSLKFSPEIQTSMESNLMQQNITTNNLEQPSKFIQQTDVNINMIMGLGPLLYKLPAELRLMILGQCIASGHPGFMRASRALHKDGQAIILEKGIYRVHLGQPYDHYGQQPNQDFVEKIQNLDVTVDLTKYRGYARVLEPFADLKIHRGHCNLVLKVVCVPNLVAGIELLRPVWHFAGFKKVGLWVDIVETQGLKLNCSCSDAQLLENRDERWVRNFVISRLGKVGIVKAKDCFRISVGSRKQPEVIAGNMEG